MLPGKYSLWAVILTNHSATCCQKANPAYFIGKSGSLLKMNTPSPHPISAPYHEENSRKKKAGSPGLFVLQEPEQQALACVEW
jgi:hypothetical protein